MFSGLTLLVGWWEGQQFNISPKLLLGVCENGLLIQKPNVCLYSHWAMWNVSLLLMAYSSERSRVQSGGGLHIAAAMARWWSLPGELRAMWPKKRSRTLDRH